MKVVLSEMAGLFEVIKDRDDYEGIVDICVDKLSDISSQLENYAMVAAGNQKIKILEDGDDCQEIVALPKCLGNYRLIHPRVCHHPGSAQLSSQI